MNKNFFIAENDFRVWLPDVAFIEKADDKDAYNSRQMMGIFNTSRRDRQGEIVIAKGLDVEDFVENGAFNDNHSQATSAIVGYPEAAQYHKSLSDFTKGKLETSGWVTRGYILKGTKRADAIWELAKALQDVPNKKLGFSIEGKVIRRSNKTIEKAKIRNVAVTNCPVNTDCTWEVLSKSFFDEDLAIKSMMAGYATSPATQSGGGALRSEDLDSDVKAVKEQSKRKKALKRAISFDEMLETMEFVLKSRPDYDEEAAAVLVNHLYRNGGKL